MVRTAALMLLALAGCKKQNDSICLVPMSLQATIGLPDDSTGWAAKVDACSARWAMRLSHAPGSINEIAEATMGGCSDAVGSLTSAQRDYERKSGWQVSDFDSKFAENRKHALEVARFYAAVSRAGNCPTP